MYTQKTGILLILFFAFLTGNNPLKAQHIKPGFDKEEYRQLLFLTAHNSEPSYSADIPYPSGFRLVYRSPELGLDNLWELWENKENGQIVISIRSSIAKKESWLENFYSAMIPAKGTLKLGNGESFEYALAEDSKATVHVGWTLGMAYLAKDILPKIDSCYQQNIRQVYIVGHSQGGAISCLLTAYLKQLQKKGTLPADLQMKTYASAAPKAGNLFFAYDYSKMTQNGYAYTVINREDWVPETPFSVQTTDDFPTISPIPGLKWAMKQQGLFKRIVFKTVYNKMDKPPKKAVKRYQQYLGKMAGKFVGKSLPGVEVPTFATNNNYVRVGSTIVLSPDEPYFLRFPSDEKNIMAHHSFQAYLYLLDILDY